MTLINNRSLDMFSVKVISSSVSLNQSNSIRRIYASYFAFRVRYCYVFICDKGKQPIS
jgi:hypothetical protein